MKSSELTKLRAQVVTIQEQLQLVLEAIDRLEQEPDFKEIRQITKTGEFRLDQELCTIPDFPITTRDFHLRLSREVLAIQNPEVNYYDLHPTNATLRDLLSLSKGQIRGLPAIGKKKAQKVFDWMEKHHLEFNCERFLT